VTGIDADRVVGTALAKLDEAWNTFRVGVEKWITGSYDPDLNLPYGVRMLLALTLLTGGGIIPL
jgi:hypothetical protein